MRRYVRPGHERKRMVLRPVGRGACASSECWGDVLKAEDVYTILSPRRSRQMTAESARSVRGTLGLALPGRRAPTPRMGAPAQSVWRLWPSVISGGPKCLRPATRIRPHRERLPACRRLLGGSHLPLRPRSGPTGRAGSRSYGPLYQPARLCQCPRGRCTRGAGGGGEKRYAERREILKQQRT